MNKQELSIRISEIARYNGKTVTLSGWLYNKRSSGKLRFLLLRDGTGIMQCVALKGDLPENVFNAIDNITQESAIHITGKVKEEKRSPMGFELGITNIKIQHISNEYPITKKDHGTDFLMDRRHLWLRSTRQHALLIIRSQIIKAIREFLDNQGFVLVDAPIITSNACEGTSTLFKTDYFGNPAFLAQSGQLYMEAAAMSVGRAYCFGPAFRAEASNTRRHLTEFWMVEPEAAFFDLDDDMALAENLVSYIIEKVLENCAAELQKIERDITPLKNLKPPFPRISYDQAVEILKSSGEDFSWGDDFGGSHETIISGKFSKPVMVHRYPAECKAFYMKNDPENKSLALCMDMLAPEGYGEIIGGGQREDDYDTLAQKIRRHNLSMEDFQWYLDLRRFGSVPHAGFGLGIERTVAWICGLPHVRETIPFPRMPNRLKP